MAFAKWIPALGKHVIVPACKPIRNATFVEEFHLTWIRHHMIFTGATLELGSKQGFIPLHGMCNIIDDPVVMHIAVGNEFRNMIDAKQYFTLITIKIFIHGNIDRKFVAVSIDPSWK